MLGASQADYIDSDIIDEDEIGYTIPESKTRPIGISKALLGAGAMMVAFPIVQGIISKSFKGASRAVAGAARRYAGTRYSQIYNRLGGSPTLGKILEETQPVKDMVTRYTRWRGDISEYTKWNRQAKSRWLHTRSFFKGYGTPAFRSRVMGAAENFTKGYLSMLPAIYLSDKAISMFTGESKNEGVSWWNIPHRIANTTADFLTTSAAYLPIHAAFQGGMNAVKLVKNEVIRSARYAALEHHTHRTSNSVMAEALGTALRRVDDWRTKSLGTEKNPGFESRLRGATKEWFRSFRTTWKDKKPATIDTINYWKGNIVEGWKKGAWPESRHFLTQVPHAQFIKDLDKVAGLPMTGGDYARVLKDIMSNYKKPPKMGFLTRMMGLRPMRVKEYIGQQGVTEMLAKTNLGNMLRSGISHTPGMHEVDLNTNITKWLGRSYMGPGIYKGPFGRPINLSRWQPRAVISRAVDYLHENAKFHTPVATIAPFEIFRAKRIKNWLLGIHEGAAEEFVEDHVVRVGPNPEHMGELPGYQTRGAYVELGRNDRMLHVRDKGGKGRLYFSKGNPSGGIGEAVDITPVGVSYKLVEEPLHGALRITQDRAYGAKFSESNRDPLNRFGARNPDEEMRIMQESLGWSKLKSWLHAKVLRTPVDRYYRDEKHGWWPGLEIGAYGEPGPLRRVSNFHMKYFREDSPLVIYNKDKGYLSKLRAERPPNNYINEGNIEDIGRFALGTRNMLNDTLNNSWHTIRSRYIYSRFSKHTVEVPGWNGKSPTFEELYGDNMSSRQRLITAVERMIGLPGADSPENIRIRHILDTVKDNDGYWRHVVEKSPRGKEITAADELQKYVFKNHIITQAARSGKSSYLQDLTKDIDVGRKRIFSGINEDRTMLRAVDNLARFEAESAGMNFHDFMNTNSEVRRELLASLVGPNKAAAHGDINKLLDFMMGESQNLDDVAQIFNPPTSTRLPNILKAPIYSGTTTNSRWEVVISGYPDVVKQAGMAGHTKDIKDYFKVIQAALMPRYIDRSGNPGPNQAITGAHRFLLESTMRFERLGEAMGFGLNPATRTTWQDIWAGTMSRIVLPGMAVYSGYKLLDTIFDNSPLFAGSSLHEGLSVALAEQYVKANLVESTVADTIGITSVARHLEGLMPGFVSSPAARLARALGPPILGAGVGMKFGPAGAGLGAITGTIMSAATGFGTFDLTKSKKELKDIYSGRELVPIRRSRFWEMSRQSYFGDRIQYWRPHAFAKMKSQYQYTPDMYGSKLEEFLFRNPIMQPFAMVVDPYHWERKSYFSSPYPETGGVMESVPFIGPVLSTTIGRVIKPIKMMHRAELQASFNGPSYMGGGGGIGPGYMPPAGIQADIPSPFIPATISEINSEGLELRRPAPVSMFGLRQTVGRMFNRGWTEPMGLFGWASQTVLRGGPATSDVVMANAGERTSVRRALWDMQLGGGAIYGEWARRFYPRIQSTLDFWNPIKNSSPSWLPGGPENRYFKDFKSGGPKIPDSELRLPSWGNMAAYNVKLSMPFRASQMGKSYEEMVQYITGTRPPTSVYNEEVMEEGTTIHRLVQEELRRSNLLVKAEAPVYEPYSDISGTVDAIVKQGRRNVAIEIKTVDEKKLESLASPESQHRSQLNFYLKVLKMKQGQLIYVARDNPVKTKTFPVYYSEELYRKDLGNLQAARSEAYKLLKQGYGNPGEAYSHLDRLRVTSDVAPYSVEYKRELQIVNRLDRLGLLTIEEHDEKIKILKRRSATMRYYDLYPRRFGLKSIIRPDSSYQIMAENEYTKAASEYSPVERLIGTSWEYITHQRSPLHTKLMATYSPRENYERYFLWGSKNAFWEEPYRDFVEPYMRATLSTHRPDEGVIRGLQAGYLLGGPAGAAIGAGALGVYGTVNMGFKWLTDTTYIPGNVKKRWDISDYFDKLKYIKARRLYMITGDKEYAQTMGETMVGINPTGNIWKFSKDISRAVPPDVRPFIFAFIQTTDPKERDRISKEVPDPVAQLLRIKWAQNDKVGNTETMVANYKKSMDLTGYFSRHNMPPEDYAGFDPRLKLEDVELKTVEKLGYSAYDFSLGYQDQRRRIQFSPFTPGPIDIGNPTGNPVYPELGVDKNELRSSILSVLSQYGASSANVSVNVTAGTGSIVQINATKISI